MPLFALDPLLEGGFGWEVAGIVLLKAAVAFGLLLVSVIMMVWFERKVIGDLQNRIGPNKAGPYGLLQTLADGMKLILKEDLIPDKADRRVFVLAPYLSAVPFLVHLVPGQMNFVHRRIMRVALEHVFCNVYQHAVRGRGDVLN